ncbi:MAG: ArsA family ATPase [Candidatus Hodarchaeota archaeon]
MTLSELLDKESLRFLLFGGKGGVGKTSSAAASALWTAEHGRETLVISTDPAHSLSDSFDQNLSGGEVIPIKGVRNLYGMEINPQKAFEEYKEVTRQSEPVDLGPMGGMMGFDDLMDMNAPGADEALAFSKVLEFIQECEYDLVIFDTAPTGHTLRLLGLPEMLDSFFGKIIKLRLRFSKIFGRLKSVFGRGDSEEDKSLEQLEQLKKNISMSRTELSNPSRTSFVIVMIPEAMAVAETERLLQALYEFEIPSSHIIVNMLFPDIPDCSFCRARKTMQQQYLTQIHDTYDDFTITEVPLFPNEIRGISSLSQLSQLLGTGSLPQGD